MKKYIILVAVLLFSGALHAELITYPAPAGSVLNSDFSIHVRQKGGTWQPLPVYTAKVNNVVAARSIIENTSLAYFDFTGEVEVEITNNRSAITSAGIRPLSSRIIYKTTGNTISFSLTKPQNLSIEINGDIFHNLQLFANRVVKCSFSPGDKNVIYYGPGVHRIGTLALHSNQTAYIAGGAVVEGRILVDKATNVRITGHGILTQLPIVQDDSPVAESSSSNRKNHEDNSRNDELTINYSKDVEVDGIILLPHKYSVLIGQSTNVKISGIKSISSEGNADGIDVFCSAHITIDSVFMRNGDDCIAIYGHRWAYYGNTTDVKVSNSVLWADVAHPILIGTHGDSQHPDTLGKMYFTNIDILDQHENQIDYQGCLALNAGDCNLIRDIHFNNIRIGDIRKGQLVNIRVMYNHFYNTAPGNSIDSIVFKDVSYNGDKAGLCIISGYDDQRTVSNIIFDNLRINGQLIYDDMPGKPGFYKTGDMAGILIGEHTNHISFIRSDNGAETQ